MVIEVKIILDKSELACEILARRVVERAVPPYTPNTQLSREGAKMYSVNAIADYFICKADPEAGDAMTHLKVQKLVYYAQGWHLALFDSPLFGEEIQAWPHGPACPVLYRRFRDKKWDPILPNETGTDPNQIEKETQEFLDEVWDVFGQFSAKRLEEIAHADEPWRNARFNGQGEALEEQVISHASMKEYFTSLSKQ